MNYTNYSIDMIYNKSNLNIFSDASMRKCSSTRLDTCYGSVAVVKDNIIDQVFKINTDTTVPAAELRGIRLSLDLAFRYRHLFPTINIFSDSKISVFSLRQYFYKWKYNKDTGLYYTGYNNKPVKNQELIYECIMMIEELSRTNNINILHQKGHVNSNVEDLKDAITVFKRENSIDGKVDYNVIRYISTYNNYVDNNSRSIIRRTNVYENTYRDPITFHPLNSPLLLQ